MKKRLSFRTWLLLAALFFLACGVLGSVLHDQGGSSGGVPTRGTVVSVRRDSLGCETKWPFAAKDCRFIVKIRHRVDGSSFDESYIHAETFLYIPPPALSPGDPVTGSCDPRGRCRFDQLERRPWGLYLGLGALALAGWALARRWRRGISSSSR